MVYIDVINHLRKFGMSLGGCKRNSLKKLKKGCFDDLYKIHIPR